MSKDGRATPLEYFMTTMPEEVRRCINDLKKELARKDELLRGVGRSLKSSISGIPCEHGGYCLDEGIVQTFLTDPEVVKAMEGVEGVGGGEGERE